MLADQDKDLEEFVDDSIEAILTKDSFKSDEDEDIEQQHPVLGAIALLARRAIA